MDIIFPQQVHGKHDIVDIAKNKSMLFSVAILLFQEGDGMIAPVSSRIEMVGGMVAVVIAEAVALNLLAVAKTV